MINKLTKIDELHESVMSEQVTRDSYAVLPDDQQKSAYPTIVGDVVALRDDVAEVEYVAPDTGVVRSDEFYTNQLREPSEQEYQEYMKFIKEEYNSNFLG